MRIGIEKYEQTSKYNYLRNQLKFDEKIITNFLQQSFMEFHTHPEFIFVIQYSLIILSFRIEITIPKNINVVQRYSFPLFLFQILARKI